MEQHQPISRYSFKQTVNYRGEQIELHPDEDRSIIDHKINSTHKKTYIKQKQQPLYKKILENKARVSNTSSVPEIVNQKLLNYTVNRCKQRNKLFKKVQIENTMPVQTGKLKQAHTVQKSSKNIKQAIQEFIGMSLFRSRKRYDKNKKTEKDSLKTQIFKMMLQQFNERQIQETNQDKLLSLYKDLSDGLKLDSLSLIKHKQIPIITKQQKQRLTEKIKLSQQYNSINEIMNGQDRMTVPIRISTDRQQVQNRKIVPQNCFKHMILQSKQKRPIKLSLHQSQKKQQHRRQLSIFQRKDNEKYCNVAKRASICQYFTLEYIKQSKYKIQEQLNNSSKLWTHSKKWTPISVGVQQNFIGNSSKILLQFQTTNSLVFKKLSFLNCLLKINPKILSNLFNPPSLNTTQNKIVYSMWLFLDDIFREVKVSQWFPIQQSYRKKQLIQQYTIDYLSNLQLYPAKTASNLWFHIILKCFAIYYQTYEKFFTLNPGQILTSLLGIECFYKTKNDFGSPVQWKIYVIKNLQQNETAIILCENSYYIIKEIDTFIKKNTIKLTKISIGNNQNEQYFIPFSEVYKKFEQIVIIPSKIHFFYTSIQFKVKQLNMILLSNLACRKQTSFYLNCSNQIKRIHIYKIIQNKNESKKRILTLISSTQGRCCRGVLKKGIYKIFYEKGSISNLFLYLRSSKIMNSLQCKQISLNVTCASSSSIEFNTQSNIKTYDKYLLQNQQNYFYEIQKQNDKFKYS